MKTIQLLGTISSTSDKKGDFDTNRKSIWFNFLDKDEMQKAKDFGLSVYTSKEDGKDFTVIKASKQIKVYDRDNNLIDVKSGIRYDEDDKELQTKYPNFHSDNSVVAIAVNEGENKGNNFHRVYAIMGEVVEFEGESPFGNIADKLDF